MVLSCRACAGDRHVSLGSAVDKSQLRVLASCLGCHEPGSSCDWSKLLLLVGNQRDF